MTKLRRPTSFYLRRIIFCFCFLNGSSKKGVEMTMTLTMTMLNQDERERDREMRCLLALFVWFLFVCLFKARINSLRRIRMWRNGDWWWWWVEGVSNKDVVRFLIFLRLTTLRFVLLGYSFLFFLRVRLKIDFVSVFACHRCSSITGFLLLVVVWHARSLLLMLRLSRF